MFNKLKGMINDISTNGVPLKITSGMLEHLINRNEDVKNVKVEISPEYFVLHGETEVKKMMLKKNISFTLKLKPVQIENRSIQFELVEMKPVDMNFINNKIFNRPPFLEYNNRTLIIDFNAWDNVKKVPVGNIKSYEMLDGAINLKLSV